MTEQSVQAIFKAHPHEWLLIDISEWDEATTTPLKGKLVAHSKSRDDVYNKLLRMKKKQLPLVVYSSETLPKGYALAL